MYFSFIWNTSRLNPRRVLQTLFAVTVTSGTGRLKNRFHTFLTAPPCLIILGDHHCGQQRRSTWDVKHKLGLYTALIQATSVHVSTYSPALNLSFDSVDRRNGSWRNTIRCNLHGRSQWPCGLRHEPSSLAGTLGSWVQIPLKTWMSVFVLSCV
jgi:hypothetical protein